MPHLIYGALTSLDGYTVEADGNFEWAHPDDEVHAFVNDLERSTGTYLYGRRMYETMSAWQTMPDDPEHPAIDDYARIWRAADKVVFSSTLEAVSTPRTRLEREFDPAVVHSIEGTVSVGGPTLAASAVRAGLVDEFWMLVFPVIVGGGTPLLPQGVRLNLVLVESRTFASGVVFVRYRRG